MKARFVIILGFALAVVHAFGQASKLSPGMAAYCLNPSLVWIPLATGSGGGAAPYRQQQIPLYGQNGGVSYPIRCDTNGNLITGGAVGGDLSGSLPNPTVVKVNGAAVPVSKSVVGTDASGHIIDASTGPLGYVAAASQIAGVHGSALGVRVPLALNWSNQAGGILCDDGNGNISMCASNAAKFGTSTQYAAILLGAGVPTTGHIATWYNTTNAIQDGGGIYAAALTTTAATTDNVTVTGMIAAGHCQLTPTNATGATNIGTTYVSAKTTNQITVTHTATSGMTFDVLCTTF